MLADSDRKTKSPPMTCAERLIGDAASRLVDDLELGAQHAGLAGLVDRAQRPLPEPASSRQQRVVGDERCLVSGFCLEPRAAELPVDLPADLAECSPRSSRRCRASCARRPSGRPSRRRCLTARRSTEKRSISFCSVGLAVSAAWPVATTRTWLPKREEQPSTKCWTCQRLRVVIVDVLLHLVEHDEREGQLAVGRALQLENLLEGVEHLVVADVVDHRVLVLQRGAHCCSGCRRTLHRRRSAPAASTGETYRLRSSCVEGLAGASTADRAPGRRCPRSSGRSRGGRGRTAGAARLRRR